MTTNQWSDVPESVRWRQEAFRNVVMTIRESDDLVALLGTWLFDAATRYLREGAAHFALHDIASQLESLPTFSTHAAATYIEALGRVRHDLDTEPLWKTWDGTQRASFSGLQRATRALRHSIEKVVQEIHTGAVHDAAIDAGYALVHAAFLVDIYNGAQQDWPDEEVACRREMDRILGGLRSLSLRQ